MRAPPVRDRVLEALLRDAGVVELSGPSDAVVRIASFQPMGARDALYLALPNPQRIAAGGSVEADVRRAFASGARAFVAEEARPAWLPREIPWARVTNVRAATEHVLAAWHAHPSRALRVLAVTGTKGKTTTAFFLRHVLERCGRDVGLVCSVEWAVRRARRSLHTAGLPPARLTEMLAEMRVAGCSDAVIEVVSANLSTDRMAATEVAVGGFTNLSRDHLDVHGTMEAYAGAKGRLFAENARAACFHVGDATGERFARAFAGPRVTVRAGAGEADLVARIEGGTMRGAVASIVGLGASRPLVLAAPGVHNVENALVAIGMASLAGVAIDDAIEALADATLPPGRMQRVEGPREVYVDYAHTPDSLAKILAAARPYCAGRLICVFGAGGDRDRGKRPEMGAAVAAHADVVILTSDNPRSEPPRRIIDEIAAGVPASAEVHVEVDRREAIFAAVRLARPDDVVIVAGRGVEESREIGGAIVPFRDDRVVCEAFATIAP
jgi:UDP-N-acetylmuramyl-tripeptide synthetase